MRRFFEFWIGFTVGALIIELLNQRGDLSWMAGRRALLSGLVAALLLTLYDPWRSRRGSPPAAKPDVTARPTCG